MKLNETNLILEDTELIATRLINKRIYAIHININKSTNLDIIRRLDALPNELFIQFSKLRKAQNKAS